MYGEMPKEEAEFKTLAADLFKSFGSAKPMCLASCEGERVSSRQMSIVIFRDKFYFQTDTTFLKYSQIMKNAHVALCFENISIQGLAKEKGSPLQKENKEFLELYKKNYPKSFERYSSLKNEVVFEVSPILISLWNYQNEQPCRAFYDFKKEEYREGIYCCQK